MIACGYEHSLTLDSSGNVWGFGCGVHKELGPTAVDKNPIPILLTSSFDVPIVCIAAGNYHSIFCDINGKVWTFGQDSLSLGSNTRENHGDPSIVPGLSNIIRVYAGDDHNAYLDYNNEVWLSGPNLDYRLGFNTTARYFSPTKLDLPNVISVACGANHTLFLNDKGEVYSCGATGYGQLGRSGSGELGKIDMDDEFDSVACGTWFSIIKSRSGQVYTFGCNTDKQLGRTDEDVGYSFPGPVEFPKKVEIVSISCAYYHSIFLDNEGFVWTCGRNCGPATPSALGIKRMPEIKYANTISVGGQHTIVKAEGGSLWAFGDNAWGQLGIQDTRVLINYPVSLNESHNHIVGRRHQQKSARK